MRVRLIVVFVVSAVLAGCLQGPTGPAGDQSFLVKGYLNHQRVQPDTINGAVNFYMWDTIPLTASVLAIRDQRYPSQGIASCPIPVYLGLNGDTTDVAANSLFRVQLYVSDSAESDGFHITSIGAIQTSWGSPLPAACTYTIVFP